MIVNNFYTFTHFLFIDKWYLFTVNFFYNDVTVFRYLRLNKLIKGKVNIYFPFNKLNFLFVYRFESYNNLLFYSSFGST